MEKTKITGIKNPERYSRAHEITREYCLQAIGYILKKIDQNLESFTEQFPAPASKNHVYPAVENVHWTSSFWTGMLWLAYEVTGEKRYREVAEKQRKSYKERIDERKYTDTHDLGFLYSLSCVAEYKLTQNREAKETALKAADLLMERYHEKAGIIQAWGDLKDPAQQGRIIVDCCMNLPLLYWAAQVTGDKKYYDAAYRHVVNAAGYIVRDDASTYHTYHFDVETGKPRFGSTHQGYSDKSCWSRGQAWAIYGFPLSYIHTGDPKLIEETKRVANYFLNHLPEDYVCYWDLIFTDGSEERDSSAAAIAACGLLEAAKHLPLTDAHKKYYENAALEIVKSLTDNYLTVSCPESNGILMHAVYGKPQGNGVDECNIWGDYYYFEALVRLLKDWKLYW